MARLCLAVIVGTLLGCPAPTDEATLRVFQAGGGGCNLHLLSPKGEAQVGGEKACYSTLTHQMYGVALGASGGVVMALAREGTNVADLIVDDGSNQTISLSTSAIWQVAVDAENYILARPDIVGVLERSDGTVRTLAEEYSHLYTANVHAFGWQSSPPGQAKYVDWVAYSSQERRALARLDGAEGVVDGSADYLIGRTGSGLLRAARNGRVQSIPESEDVAQACIWGERVVIVSASDRRSVRVWSEAQGSKSFSLPAGVDDLLCGCGASPFFIAISWEGQGRSMGVKVDGDQFDLPFPLLRSDNPGPFWTSDCKEPQ